MYRVISICGLLILLALADGREKHFKWAKTTSALSTQQDWAVFNNSFGEPVIVSLKVRQKPAPLNFSIGLADFVKFYLYTRKNPTDCQQLWVDDSASLSSSNFDKSKKTLVVTHGYMDSLSSNVIQDIKNNVLQIEDVNVIGIDWSLIADLLFYHIIAVEVPYIGDFAGSFLIFLAEQGLPAENLHLIGHSLGAHLVGFAGKRFKEKGIVARISGLDPALPGFEWATKNERLDFQDAMFVDIIHTCGGALGFMDPIGHADFYPNGGINIQPGCTWLDFGICSHGRSVDYFAESILNGHSFPVLTCPAVPTSQTVDCVDNGVKMGYKASNKFTGIFYGVTNAQSPFAPDIE